MARSEKILLWVTAAAVFLILAVGVPWAMRIESRVAAADGYVNTQQSIDERLLTIYGRVRRVQEAIEQKFGDDEGGK